MRLSQKKCIPSKKGEQPYSDDVAKAMLIKVNSDWELLDKSTKLSRSIRFKNFSSPMKLAVVIGEIADHENHHPDLHISWGRLVVTITTHTINGLAESDFIFAAKVDDAVELFKL